MPALTDDNYIPNSTTVAKTAPSIPAKAKSLCERLGSGPCPNLFTDPTYLPSHIIVCNQPSDGSSQGSIPYLSRISIVALKDKISLRVGFIPFPPGATVIFALADARFSIGSLVHPLPLRQFRRAPYVIKARILACWWDGSPWFTPFREPFDDYLSLKAWKKKRVDEWETQSKDAAKMAMVLVS